MVPSQTMRLYKSHITTFRFETRRVSKAAAPNDGPLYGPFTKTDTSATGNQNSPHISKSIARCCSPLNVSNE